MFTVLAGFAEAHHSPSNYDRQKELTLHGTVVEYNWRNPHVFVIWDVKEGGKSVQWVGELNSTNSMIQLGMNRNSLKEGAEIVLVGNPAKSGEPLSITRKISTADGKLILDNPATHLN